MALKALLDVVSQSNVTPWNDVSENIPIIGDQGIESIQRKSEMLVLEVSQNS